MGVGNAHTHMAVFTQNVICLKNDTTIIYIPYENQLKNLFDMRMNGEINSETHEAKKAEITTLRDEAKEKLNKTDNRLDKWLNDAESDFKWAEEAISIIKSDDLPAKRIILEKLGTTIVLQKTGVEIELSPILKLVRRTNKTLKKDNASFEPNNNIIEYGQKSYFDPLSLQLGGYRELNPN